MVSGVRIGRWHNVKQSKVINVRTTIDSFAETFPWRPYTLAVEGWLIPKFYKENEELTIVEGKNVDHELETFVRFLRVSELVGLDCQEHYRPNRVALQFGYDQDFPKWIPRSSSSPELAWYNYSRPIDSDFRSKKRLKRISSLYDSTVFAPKLKQVKVATPWDVCDVPPDLPTECQLKQVKNYPDVPPGFPPRCCWENDKRDLSMVCQTVACDVVPPGSAEKQTDCEQAILFPVNLVKVESPWDVCDVLPDLPTEYQLKQVGDYPYVPPPPDFSPKCCGENDKKNLSMEFSQTMACDIVPPGLMEKHNDGESIYASTDAHDSNESSSVVSPKRIGENDKENLSRGVCQTVACNIVLPGLMEKHKAGQSAYTSTDAHHSNETSSVVPSKCVVEYDTENLSMLICQTVACDFVPLGSMENHLTVNAPEVRVKAA
ncbi:hypothetical protein P3L10_034096 [Capsicum annuum]